MSGNFAKGYGSYMTLIGGVFAIFIAGIVVGTIFGTVMTVAERPACVKGNQ